MIKVPATLKLFPRSYNMLSFLHESSFEFRLTGSHFFGTDRSDSDYDLIVEDSLEVRNFLTREGFMPVENVYSDDLLTSHVYRLMPIRCKVWGWNEGRDEPEMAWIDNGTGSILPGNEGFDIQVTNHLDHKLLVQRILKDKYPNGLAGEKDQKADLWKLVLHTLQSVGIIPSDLA